MKTNALTKPGRVLPAIVLTLCAGWVLYVIAVVCILPDPRNVHAQKLTRFMEVGRKIKAQIDRGGAGIVPSVDDLAVHGVISGADKTLLIAEQIRYHQPGANASNDWVILSWPLENGVCYEFRLDGKCEPVSPSAPSD